MNQYTRANSISQEQALLRADLRSKAHERAELVLGLVIVDILAILGGFVIGAATRHGSLISAQSPLLVATMLPLYGLCANILKAYSGGTLVNRLQSLSRSMMAFVFSAAIFSWFVFLLQAGETFSRIEVTVGMFTAAALLGAGRLTYSAFCRHRLNGELYSAMILRDGSIPPREGNEESRALTLDIGRLFDPYAPTPEAFDRLAKLVGRCDRVVLECATNRRAVWTHALQGMNVHAEVVAPEFDSVAPLGVSTIDGQATLVIARGPLGLRERIIKRLFDLAFALVALLFFAPLMLAIAIAIKLDSKGPVFFMQPRIGRQNKLFHVFKFRSMYVDQNDMGGARSTSRGDPRVTRVGRIIRATSIDELPQFLNVLKGEMSIVGPRPHAVHSTAEDLLFWDIDNRYWHRHACKPGITGLAQIKGLRGATHRQSDLRDRVTAESRICQPLVVLGRHQDHRADCQRAASPQRLLIVLHAGRVAPARRPTPPRPASGIMAFPGG